MTTDNMSGKSNVPAALSSREPRLKLERLVFYAFLLLIGLTPLALTTWTDEPPGDVQWLILSACAPALATVWLFGRLFTKGLTIRWSLITLAALATLATQILNHMLVVEWFA